MRPGRGHCAAPSTTRKGAMSDLNESPGSHQQPDALLDRLIFRPLFRPDRRGRADHRRVPLTDGRITWLSSTMRPGPDSPSAPPEFPPCRSRLDAPGIAEIDQTGDALTSCIAGAMKSRLPRRGSTARSGLRSTCCKGTSRSLVLRSSDLPLRRAQPAHHLPRPRRWFWDAFLANRWIYGWRCSPPCWSTCSVR